MKPECPWYIPPKLYVNPETDEDVEGSAMCALVDKYCLVEYGSDCQVYNDFLKEVEDEREDFVIRGDEHKQDS